MTRDAFREHVFRRDNHCCVMCHLPAVDAHHILERRLFPDGGYEIRNGASLCADCHMKAEMTHLTVEEIRAACGILEKDKVIPDHLYPDQVYDKWGNPVLPNGTRLMGELFDDPSVQKILEHGDVLRLFSKYVKYPRTWHLPWSQGATKDDRVLKDSKHFEGKKVVVTLKMDGENTTLYNDYIHARSLNDKKHWSKTWIKNYHAGLAADIPDNVRIVVENLYAKHSIKYIDLKSYAYGISVWEGLQCYPWTETLEWFELLGMPVVPELYRGVWDADKVRDIFIDHDLNEGYVVRLEDGFHYKDFAKSVAKYVRASHITSNDHWFFGNAGEKNEIVV